MIMSTLGIVLAQGGPIDSNPVTIGPGSIMVAVVTVFSSIGTVLGLLASARRWVNTAIKTSDGRSVVAVLEGNTRTLEAMAQKVEKLSDDVAELRIQHSGIDTRLSHLEKIVLNPGRGRRFA